MFAEIDPVPDVEEKPSVKTEALCRRCTALYGEYAEISGNVGAGERHQHHDEHGTRPMSPTS